MVMVIMTMILLVHVGTEIHIGLQGRVWIVVSPAIENQVELRDFWGGGGKEHIWVSLQGVLFETPCKRPQKVRL